MTGTPDDYRPLPDNVIQLVTAYTYRKQTSVGSGASTPSRLI
jgi:hypothetical protein